MVPTELSQSNPPATTEPGFGKRILAGKPGLYTFLVLVVALGAGAYGLRKYSIFNCKASGYASDGYLAYCNALNYGDYDHGAFWFGLEPAASAAASKAQVLFLGNSRMQFGLSTKALADWFSSLHESYYLLGFSHFENYTFEAPLVRKLHPSAKVYVINIDSFFERSETGPGKTVMQDDSATTRYEQKRNWQRFHRSICGRFPVVCGNGIAFFRSGSTGAWRLGAGSVFKSEPVSYDEEIDAKMLQSYTVVGDEFLPSLSVGRECTILTIVPTVKTSIGTAKAIAVALGLNLVAPELVGLSTFDESHLDPESAQRWSAAFIEGAGSQIQECLSK